MTDALTDTHAEDASAGTIAPPAEPEVEPRPADPDVPHDEPVADESAADQPQFADGGDGDEPEAESGSFGQRISRWFRGLGNRLMEAPAESFVTFAVVGFCVGFVLFQLGPANLFANNTPAGGDMGAHVWGPAFMRDHLLTKGRLTGWTPDWYAGFPAYQFYMVLPSLAIALLSFIIPYGVAFKLVAVSGVVTLPIAAWAFAKLVDLPFPAPPLFAVAGTVYLFDRSFSIYGGNIPSTLAGEFAFSISLSFAMLFLGVFWRALRTGSSKYRGWSAILLALCGLCHLIPFIFAMIGAVLIVMLMPGLTSWSRERIGSLVGLGAAGGLFYLANPAKGYTSPYGFLDFLITPSPTTSSILKVLAVMVLLVSLVALALTILTAGRHLLYIGLPAVIVGGLLTAWWSVPFYLNHKFMNDMGWEKKDDVQNALFLRSKLDPQLVDAPPIKWLLILAGAGALLSLIWWRRGGLFWIMIAATFGLLYVYMPEGRLWNARLLPFYYLALYFLAAVGIAEVSRLVATLFARDVNRPIRAVMNVTAAGGLLALVVVALPLHTLPFGSTNPEDGTYSWGFKTPHIQLNDAPHLALGLGVIALVALGVGVFFLFNGRKGGVPITAVAAGALALAFLLGVWPNTSGRIDVEYAGLRTNDSSFISSWATWNFTGYEGKAAYPEYHDIIQTMKGVGEQDGCGRAMWEHEEQHDRYGTPMALMLMPFWTDGCIGSMEGLYFEASSTTPYHFINQDELSRNPSNAQRDLPYRAGPPTKDDFDLGIEHLKMLGVRYYMAISEGPDGMIALARQNKSLKEVADSGPWAVFQITDGNDLVEPLKYEPAVVQLNDASQPMSQDLQSVPNPDGTPKPKTGSTWQFMSMDWYQDQKAWDTYLAAGGPDDWQHINRGDAPKLKAEKPITVSNISTTDDNLSFDVSEPGVPVLVKMSYFPNWKASGANGPWRVTPNLMVVVPTSNHVELHYGYTGVDYLSWLLTLLGLVGVVWLFRSKAVKVPDPSDPNSVLLEPEAGDAPWIFDPSTGSFVPGPGHARYAGPGGAEPPGTGPGMVGWGVTVPEAPPYDDGAPPAGGTQPSAVDVMDRAAPPEADDHELWRSPIPSTGAPPLAPHDEVASMDELGLPDPAGSGALDAKPEPSIDPANPRSSDRSPETDG